MGVGSWTGADPGCGWIVGMLQLLDHFEYLLIRHTIYLGSRPHLINFRMTRPLLSVMLP